MSSSNCGAPDSAIGARVVSATDSTVLWVSIIAAKTARIHDPFAVRARVAASSDVLASCAVDIVAGETCSRTARGRPQRSALE